MPGTFSFSASSSPPVVKVVVGTAVRLARVVTTDFKVVVSLDFVVILVAVSAIVVSTVFAFEGSSTKTTEAAASAELAELAEATSTTCAEAGTGNSTTTAKSAEASSGTSASTTSTEAANETSATGILKLGTLSLKLTLDLGLFTGLKVELALEVLVELELLLGLDLTASLNVGLDLGLEVTLDFLTGLKLRLDLELIRAAAESAEAERGTVFTSASLLMNTGVVNEVELVTSDVTVVAPILVDRSSFDLVKSLIGVVEAILVNVSDIVTINRSLVSLVEGSVAIDKSILVDVTRVISTGKSDVVTGAAAETSVAVATVGTDGKATVATVATIATVATVASGADTVSVFVDADATSRDATGTGFKSTVGNATLYMSLGAERSGVAGASELSCVGAASGRDATVRVTTGASGANSTVRSTTLNVSLAAEGSSVAGASELSGVRAARGLDATVRSATGARGNSAVRRSTLHVRLGAVRSSVARAVGAVAVLSSPGSSDTDNASENKLVHFWFVDYVKNLRISETSLLK